jgi:hypothetical protein
VQSSLEHDETAAPSGPAHVEPQRTTVTITGFEAIPLATTSSRLGPMGVDRGNVNRATDLVPGAVETELQLNVRAYVVFLDLPLTTRMSG